MIFKAWTVWLMVGLFAPMGFLFGHDLTQKRVIERVPFIVYVPQGQVAQGTVTPVPLDVQQVLQEAAQAGGIQNLPPPERTRVLTTLENHFNTTQIQFIPTPTQSTSPSSTTTTSPPRTTTTTTPPPQSPPTTPPPPSPIPTPPSLPTPCPLPVTGSPIC